MNKPVIEWIEKAEEDYRVALALRRLRQYPAHGSVCFHAQQCIEKYLKAMIEAQHVVIRKTHALPVLLDECVKAYPLLVVLRPDMIRLTEYAVEFRYPGESATEEDSSSAIRIMKRTRDELRMTLRLVNSAKPPPPRNHHRANRPKA